MASRSFKFSIDRGGTFTDIYCSIGNDKQVVLKLLSEDPANYNDAPTEGIRRILEQVMILGLIRRLIVLTRKLVFRIQGTFLLIPQELNIFEWGLQLLQMLYLKEKVKELH